MRSLNLTLVFGFLSSAATGQTNPAPTPAPLTDQQKKAKIMEVCKQKAELNTRLLPRDRAKYINDCVDKARAE
jgi:hypothetical protein